MSVSSEHPFLQPAASRTSLHTAVSKVVNNLSEDPLQNTSNQVLKSDPVLPTASFQSTDGIGHAMDASAPLQSLVTSHAFEVFFGLLIISNSVFIGVEIDYTASKPLAE